jgi:hypothetical protein
MATPVYLNTEPLPCGCRPGYVLCPEAVLLWEESTAKYERAKLSGNWKGYHQSRRAYDEHFTDQDRDAGDAAREFERAWREHVGNRI